MKKWSIVVAAFLVTGLGFYQPIANAQDAEETQVEQIDTTNFIKSSGVIKDIETNEDVITLTVESDDKEPQITLFKLNSDTLLFQSGTTKTVEKEAFKKGQRIDAYYDKNKPMLMIYPAQIYPELVIMHDEGNTGSVKVSKFNDEFLSLDKELKLNIGEETILENEKGEKVDRADLSGKELIVFYNISTKSIPAQTAPTKIIAINNLSPEMKEIQTIIDNDHFMQNGTKMIPLKKVAEQLGYVVLTYSNRLGTYLKLDNSSLIITAGDKTYYYNRSLQQFAETPVLKEGKTYVSEDILEMLIP